MGIHIANISKSFGKKKVIDSCSFSIESGQCFWLVGKNGAGKSTLINIISNLLPPDQGTINFDGVSYQENALGIKRQLGVVSDKSPAIPQLSGFEYLQFLGLMHEISNDECERRIKSLFSFFFDDFTESEKRINKYSFGMKKKIAICAALLHRPRYLLLDEPFSGLDPVSAAKLIEFLKAFVEMKNVLFISSHDLGYSQQIMTHIGVLHEGKLIAHSSAKELSNTSKNFEESLLSLLQFSHIQMESLSWLLA
jgi:ABC-2 type transport system ATP-binding protein